MEMIPVFYFYSFALVDYFVLDEFLYFGFEEIPEHFPARLVLSGERMKTPGA